MQGEVQGFLSRWNFNTMLQWIFNETNMSHDVLSAETSIQTKLIVRRGHTCESCNRTAQGWGSAPIPPRESYEALASVHECLLLAYVFMGLRYKTNTSQTKMKTNNQARVDMIGRCQQTH